jgi:hypothetical protein
MSKKSKKTNRHQKSYVAELVQKAKILGADPDNDSLDDEMSTLVEKLVRLGRDSDIEKALELLTNEHGDESEEYYALFANVEEVAYRYFYELDGQVIVAVPFAIPFVALSDDANFLNLKNIRMSETLRWLTDERNLRKQTEILYSSILLVEDLKSGVSEDYFSFSKSSQWLQETMAFKLRLSGGLSKHSQSYAKIPGVRSMKIMHLPSGKPHSESAEQLNALSFAILGLMLVPVDNAEEEEMLFDTDNFIKDDYNKGLEQHISADIRKAMQAGEDSAMDIVLTTVGTPVELHEVFWFNSDFIDGLIEDLQTEHSKISQMSDIPHLHRLNRDRMGWN